ncbi:MAG: TonB-dependent receptor [Acetobacter sp.]|nr:TonB-dependent receptor [Acetobacter sp.]MCH4061725.1 TonB-dependent receptor [Acetobacter sp.]MCH4089426.1 TonB-dependent receptor [Acetobacter sp.]MCI1293798.1 TonB-dependent receptor [Acetobacter sp.]MCI1320382.1 TonB-dependent receptor [Acetobacter sp.]
MKSVPSFTGRLQKTAGGFVSRSLLLTATVLASSPVVSAYAATTTTAETAKAKVAARSTVKTTVDAGKASKKAVVLKAKKASFDASGSSENVVVTGSMLRDPNITSASPITEITRTEMARRGLKNVTDALQTLSANGGGTLTNAFTANGAFAGGASAPSLRSLSTDSTLVLMDGQRLSYYPLSDDGERNFVDTNWMPQSIMEKVDVMQDGGSATYGADAVAGVINYITRKEIRGFEGNAEGGLSQRGDTGHQRLYATYGWGDLANKGFNVYVNSEYQQDDALYNRQLGYPYKTGDLTGIGGTNGNYNVANGDGTISNFTQTPVPIVRPVTNSATGTGTGPWQLLNPSAGCGAYGGVVSGHVSGTTAGSVSQVCGQNPVGDYSQITPSLRRINSTIHLTANVTDRSQLTAMFTYSQALSTAITHRPYTTRSSTQSLQANTYAASLPVYLPNGSLNPNNPFAAEGQEAQIYYRFNDLVPTQESFSQNFRGSVRYNGSAASNWGSDWKYDANFVGMNTLLQQTYTGYPTINGIEEAIADGSYNFVDPSSNSSAVLNSIAPKKTINARTQEYSGELSLSKGLFNLPGGTADLAIGGNVRWESLNDPNANPLNPSNLGAQYAGINPFNAKGSRWVESGFFEVGLPFHKMFNADVSGRYDNYSGNMNHFSPKVGVNFKPFDQLTLRGTFSRGFRVPSFAETGGSNVGYTTYQPTDQNFINQHLDANGTPDAYAQSYSLGSNTSGNPKLKPEIATNFTGGAVFRATKWLSITADYYYIKKSHYIAPNPVGTASVADTWLSGGTLPEGVTVTPDVEDPQYPNASRRPGLINLGYINTNKLVTDGVDLAIDATTRLPGVLHNIRWYSHGTATYIHSYNLTLPNGQVQHFAGTIGNYSAVSASGTPRWRASWSNTFVYRNLSVTPTVYYTSGYKTVAEDQTGPGSRHDCSNFAAIQQAYTPSQCHVKNWWDVDLTLNYRINNRWSIYTNVYNLLGFRSPYDFATYGSYLYNSAWSQKGMVYRSFQFGVNVVL